MSSEPHLTAQRHFERIVELSPEQVRGDTGNIDTRTGVYALGVLADDLERHMSFQPVLARPVSGLCQLYRLARRHRAVVGRALATLIAILAGAGVAVCSAVRNADLAQAERAVGHDGSWGRGSGLVVPDDTWVLAALAIEPSHGTMYLRGNKKLRSSRNFFPNAPQAFDGVTTIGSDSLGAHYRGHLRHGPLRVRNRGPLPARATGHVDAAHDPARGFDTAQHQRSVVPRSRQRSQGSWSERRKATALM